MFKNYLKIAYRNLMKQKLHSSINIAGLAIGMAVSILILSYVWFHLSFDRFHSKSDQIYRVVQDYRLKDKNGNAGRTSYILASILKDEFPEIIQTTRLNHSTTNDDFEITIKGEKFIEPASGRDVVRVDYNIFNFFDIVLVQGDYETALKDPYSIIISEEESEKYFGNESPMGNFINIKKVRDEGGYDFRVTGVAKKLPENSHFQFKYLIPHEKNPWIWYKYSGQRTYTYLTLPADYPCKDLENKFPEIVKKYFASELEDQAGIAYNDWLESGGYWNLKLQPLKDIHLDNYYRSSHLVKKEDPAQVRLYALIALFIIVLACINFITLSTAKSGIRAKEVGVRKVNGAKRVQLIWQFLTESILLSIIALVFAILLVLLLSKHFSKLLEIQTSYNVSGVAFVVTSLFVLTLIVGVIAGSYPAFFLSAFKPVNVIKGQLLEKMKGAKIRNGLVVLQFGISIILIISSIAVYKQYNYMQKKDLGIDKENIVILHDMIKLWPSRGMTRDQKIQRDATFKQELLKNPNIMSVSSTQSMPGMWERGSGYGNRIVRTEGSSPETNFSIKAGGIDCYFMNVFGLELAEGKNFNKMTTVPETIEGVILNEKAVNYLGLKNPIGKYIYSDNWSEWIKNKEGKWESMTKTIQIPIIGVFKDFHTHDLHKPIPPTIFFPMYKGVFGSNVKAIKFLPGNIHNNISFIEKTFKDMGGKRSLVYSFLDKDFEYMYRKEKKLAQVFTFFSILAIFIACLGIFGLAALTAEQRTKEIGIRKVMGASEKNVVLLLSRIYLKLITVASLLALPMGYIIMNRWLQEFPFRIKQGVGIFIFTEIIVLAIVVSSVSYYSVKAALINPARTLKYE